MVKRTRSGQVKPAFVQSLVQPKYTKAGSARKITRSVAAKSATESGGNEQGPVYATYKRPLFTIHGINKPERERATDNASPVQPKARRSTRKASRKATRMASDYSDSVIEVHRPPSKVVDDKLAGRSASASERGDASTPIQPEVITTFPEIVGPTDADNEEALDGIHPSTAWSLTPEGDWEPSQDQVTPASQEESVPIGTSNVQAVGEVHVPSASASKREYYRTAAEVNTTLPAAPAPTGVSTGEAVDGIYPPVIDVDGDTKAAGEVNMPSYSVAPLSTKTSGEHATAPKFLKQIPRTNSDSGHAASQQDLLVSCPIHNSENASPVEAGAWNRSKSQTPDEAQLPATPESAHTTPFDASLPGPYLSRSCSPDSSESEPGSPAAHILKTEYRPIPSPTRFTSVLTRRPPSELSTSELYELALRTQEALVAWQTEYIALDHRTAPHSLPIPKKPATGGRLPLPRAVHQDMLEADLYGYTFDPKKIGHQDPWAQRPGPKANGEGRDFRRRRGERESLLAVLGISEDDAGAAGSGLEHGRRARNPVQRYEGVDLKSTPRKRRTMRGLASETPEPELNDHESGGKRKQSTRFPLSQRVRQMRAESALTATTEEDEEADVMGSPVYPDRRLNGTTSRGGIRRKRGAKANTARTRVKSEKRSQSMTIWWAERKRKAAEEKMNQIREKEASETNAESQLNAAKP